MRAIQARQQAEECRMYAGSLIALAIVSALAAGCLCYSLGAGMCFLVFLVATVVFATGYVHEIADARRLDRIARQCQPVAFERTE